MTDPELIKLVREVVIAGMATKGWSFPVVQRSQPTQQGIPTETTIYFQKMYDKRYGWPGLTTIPDAPEVGKSTEITTQNMETYFQFSALTVINPKAGNDTQNTASDISNFVAALFQRRDCIRTLGKSGVGVLRIKEVDNTYFEDDRHRNEAWPTFEVVFTHQSVTTNVVNNTADVQLAIYQVPDQETQDVH